MARTKISEFSATAADNTDIDNIDIAEGCAPSGINNAIRELMAQLKDFQAGSAGDPFNGAVNGTLGATTPAAATVTNLAYTGTLTGDTGVINIGFGQVYKDASGNFGLGTTTPAGRLQVNGTSYIGGSSQSLVVYQDGTGVSIEGVDPANPSTKKNIWLNGYGGNVGIGTSTPSAKLQVAGNVLTTGAFIAGANVSAPTADASIYRAADNTLAFSTGSTERARITSAGVLLVGTSSISENTSGAKLEPQPSNNGAVLKIMKTGSGAVNGLLFYSQGSYVGGLNFSDSATSLATSSDQRLKENVADALPISEKFSQIKVRSFDWKSDGSKSNYGFVAQELVNIFPEAVTVGKDKEDGSIEIPWSVSPGNLIPHMIKAIQELKAEFDAYKAAHP